MCEEEEDYEPPPQKKKPVRKGRRGKKLWVNLDSTHYPIVGEVFEELGWYETSSDIKPNIIWVDTGGSNEIASSLEPWQFYNHFPAIWSIARKVELLRNYEKMEEIIPDIYNFHPKSFLLPGQFSDMKQYMNSHASAETQTFIIKPDRGAQGRGIFLIQDPEQAVNYAEMAVAQQYIPPYLVDGYKFDLRIYVLLTSADPLRIYIHEEGMARFCTEPYIAPAPGNLNKAYSHLTNYSLNKKNDKFQKNTDPNDDTKGSKRSLTSIYENIKKNGGDVDKLKTDIDRIIRLTIACIQPRMEHNYRSLIKAQDSKSRLFEILGFDILIDSSLRPWLIEVNNMPSLGTDAPFDKKLKHSVVKGAIEILNLTPSFRKTVVARQKAVTQQRISGVSKTPIVDIYDPDAESEIALTTNWRQIYPLKDDPEETEKMDRAIAAARQAPVIGATETTASKARKQKISQQLAEQREKEAEHQKKTKNALRIVDDTRKAPKPKPKPKRFLPLPTAPTRSLRSKPPPLIREESIMSVFAAAPPSIIGEEDERERVRLLRCQIICGQAVAMGERVRTMLDELSGAPRILKKVQAVRSSRAVVQPVLKQAVPMRRILIDGGNSDRTLIKSTYGNYMFRK